jgi:hypothetical protein
MITASTHMFTTILRQTYFAELFCWYFRTDLYLSFLIELPNVEICDTGKDTFKTIDKIIHLYKDECV